MPRRAPPLTPQQILGLAGCFYYFGLAEMATLVIIEHTKSKIEINRTARDRKHWISLHSLEFSAITYCKSALSYLWLSLELAIYSDVSM